MPLKMSEAENGSDSAQMPVGSKEIESFTENERVLKGKKFSWGKLKRVDSQDAEACRVSGMHSHGQKVLTWDVILKLAFQSIGVVYGGIGTSPLYVYSSTFTGGIKDTDDLLGVLSLVIYTFTLVTFVKYVLIVLWANDNGDGGTFAPYSLICRYAKVSLIPNQQAEDRELSAYKLDVPSKHLTRALNIKEGLEGSTLAKNILLIVTMLGTSMVIGDGVLTPCISVLSAVSGIKQASPNALSQDAIVGISVVILICLFTVQRFGTDKVGYTFAPAILVWFTSVGLIGIYNFFKHDTSVIRAFCPKYIMDYFKRNKKDGWISLGEVVLFMTGTEAMFADLGHFSVRSIQISFASIVYPALICAYAGQAAYLRNHPAHVANTFYDSIPGPMYWPMFVVAVAATIIASQAMISGAFSIVSESLSLGCFPRGKVVHTSSRYEGRVYIPELNYLLMILRVIVASALKNTTKIVNAYVQVVVSLSGSRKKYPPAVGVLAIIRDLLLHKENRPHCIFTRWVKTYGAVYSVRTGLNSGVVVLNSYQYAKEAMVDKHSSISSKKLTMALQTLSLDKTMVALSDYGRDHRLMKKLMITHLLGSAPQKRNRYMREEMLRKITDSIYSQLKTTHTSAGTLMNMTNIVLDQLIAFAFKQVIGRDVESVYVEEMGTALSMKQIYEAIVEDPANGALEINWRDFIPHVSRCFPNRKLQRRLNEVIHRRSAVVNALIQQHRKIYWRNSSLQEREGYLEMILRDGQGLEKKQLETAIWEPIIESIITTKVALEWAMFELARNPKYQNRLHQELDKVCGDAIVTEDDLSKLPYLKAIFLETVRKYPPLPLIPLRYVHEDVELGGYHIPAGWKVLVNIYGANNCENECENPEIWKPERHLSVKEEGNTPASNEDGDLEKARMTFGAGQRLCAGWMQALVIVCMTIGRIVQNFKWELSAGHEDEACIETIVNAGTHRLRPLFAVMTPRVKNQSN